MWNRVKQNKSLTKFSFSNSLINISYLLTEYQGRTLKYRGFEAQTELARFVGKNWALSISRYGMSNPANK